MTDYSEEDVRAMELALGEAERSLSWGDVPIGAVVTRGDEVLAHTGNQRERLHDPTAHAELLAIRRASAILKSWRLEGCTLTVTTWAETGMGGL